MSTRAEASCPPRYNYRGLPRSSRTNPPLLCTDRLGAEGRPTGFRCIFLASGGRASSTCRRTLGSEPLNSVNTNSCPFSDLEIDDHLSFLGWSYQILTPQQCLFLNRAPFARSSKCLDTSCILRNIDARQKTDPGSERLRKLRQKSKSVSFGEGTASLQRFSSSGLSWSSAPLSSRSRNPVAQSVTYRRGSGVEAVGPFWSKDVLIISHTSCLPSSCIACPRAWCRDGPAPRRWLVWRRRRQSTRPHSAALLFSQRRRRPSRH